MPCSITPRRIRRTNSVEHRAKRAVSMMLPRPHDLEINRWYGGRSSTRGTRQHIEFSMKTSEKDWTHIDRRSVLRGFGNAATALSLSGCGLYPPDCICSDPLPGGAVPLAVDAHCHVFNGSDLPVYGFLDRIAIQNPFLQKIAAPLVLMISYSVESLAKTYTEELEALRHILSDPAAKPQYVPKPDGFAKFVAYTVDKFIEDRTSLGGKVSPADPRTEENDRFVLDLYSRFGLFPPAIDKSEVRRFLITKEQDLAAQIAKPLD